MLISILEHNNFLFFRFFLSFRFFSYLCPVEKIKTHIAEIAQLVEHNLAKVRVASSSLVFRSNPDKSRDFLSPALVVELVDTRDLKSRGQ